MLELALSLPLFLLLVLGIIEFGRAIMVHQMLTNGAREGARHAILPGATDAQVHQTIDNYMSNAGISGYSRTVSPSASTAASGTTISVTVSVPYSSVSWGVIRWLGSTNLSSRVVMRKE
jgi:Flp pilus assembly protein TadG